VAEQTVGRTSQQFSRRNAKRKFEIFTVGVSAEALSQKTVCRLSSVRGVRFRQACRTLWRKMFQSIENNLLLRAVFTSLLSEGLEAGGLDQALHFERRRGGLKKAEQAGRGHDDV
jgi:hypothetical protein